MDPNEAKSPNQVRNSIDEFSQPLANIDKDAEVRQSGQFPRYVQDQSRREPDRLASPFDKQQDSKPEHFRTMTSRGLTLQDQAESEVIAANVFIGNKPLWHTSLDEKRFDNFERDPECKSSTKVPR